MMTKALGSEYRRELEVAAAAPGLRDLAGSTVVLIGATGSLGHALLGILSRLPADGGPPNVIGVARRQADWPDETFVQGSADSAATYDRLPRPDYVVYIAGSTSDYLARAGETVATTISGFARCLEYARGCRGLTFVSSTRVYGSQLGHTAVTEDHRASVDPMALGNIYDSSKRLAESLLLLAYQREGTPGTVARLTNIYGPHTANPLGTPLGEMVTSSYRQRRLVLTGHPDSVRNYCFVADAAQGVLLTLAHGRRGVAYNIASEDHLTNRQFAEAVAATLPFSVEVNVSPEASAQVPSLATISIDRANKELGYRPHANLRTCLPETVDWLANALGLHDRGGS